MSQAVGKDPNAPVSGDFGLTKSDLNFFERPAFDVPEEFRRALFVAGGLLLAWFGAYLFRGPLAAAVGYGLLIGLLGAYACGGVLTGVVKGVGKLTHEARTRAHPRYPFYQQYVTAVRSHTAEAERQRQETERRQRAREEATLRARLDWWKSLDGREFEIEVARLLEGKGYVVEHRGRAGDQGVDIVLRTGDQTIVVQCKAHTNCVGPAAVRDLYGTLVHSQATEAWLVATSGFQPGAKSFARGKRIRLMTIADLLGNR